MPPNDARVEQEHDQRQTATNGDLDSQTVIDGSAAGNRRPVGSDSVPEQIGKYEIRRKLGAGGMGAVYLAFDPVINREVALKVLPEVLSQDPTGLQRFLGEARAAGALSHPNTIAVFDIGEDNGLHYIVMELAAGGSVTDRLSAEERLPFAEACRVIIEAARGLAAAHHAGLIHRDIKPENLMLTGDGTVKVGDFGLSKTIAESNTEPALTALGQVIGTPHYMSPEQFTAETPDHRSDIYSLGATFYRLLTGELPYAAKTIHQMMYAHLEEDPPDPCAVDPELPAACATVIAKAMAKKPADRYADMEQLVEAVEGLLAGTDRSDAAVEETVPSVVLVESSKLQARILEDAFRQVGAASVEVFHSAQEALDHLSGATPGVIVASGQLPDLRGQELFQRVQAKPGFGRCLSVLVTATDDARPAPAEHGTNSIAHVSKQGGASDVFRSIHAITDYRLPGFAGRVGTGQSQRVLVASADGTIPDPVARAVRAAGLVDVTPCPLMDVFNGRVELADFDLVVTVSKALNIDGAHAPRDAPVKTDTMTVIATAISDGNKVVVREVRRGSMWVRCDCELDDHRLQRLIEVV